MEELLRMYLQNSINLSIIAVLIMALSPFLSRRYSAGCRYYLWLIVIAAFLIPIRLQVNIPQAVQLIIPDSVNRMLTSVKGNGIPVHTELALNWSMIAALWIAGILCLWVWYIFHHFRFLLTVKRWSKKISMDRVVYFQKVKNEMYIKHRIDIFCCDCIRTPMMIGLLKPIVLIPTIDLTQDEFSFIIRHELIHYKRRDLFLKVISMLALTIHWFNPAVYFITRNIQNLCEISCDEEVLKDTDSKIRADYGKMLIEVIRKGEFYQTAFSENFCSRISSIKKRIYAIMDMKRKRFSFSILIAAVIFAFCGISAFTLPQKSEKNSFNQQIAASHILNSSIKSSSDSETSDFAESQYVKNQIVSTKSLDNGTSSAENGPQLVIIKKPVKNSNDYIMKYKMH